MRPRHATMRSSKQARLPDRMQELRNRHIEYLSQLQEHRRSRSALNVMAAMDQPCKGSPHQQRSSCSARDAAASTWTLAHASHISHSAAGNAATAGAGRTALRGRPLSFARSLRMHSTSSAIPQTQSGSGHQSAAKPSRPETHSKGDIGVSANLLAQHARLHRVLARQVRLNETDVGRLIDDPRGGRRPGH